MQLMGFINQFITRGAPPCTHETTDHIQFWTLEVLSAGRWPMRKRIFLVQRWAENLPWPTVTQPKIKTIL